MRNKLIWCALVLPVVALLFGGCQKDPIAQLESTRSDYTARLLGFVVDAVPVAAEPVMDESGDAGEPAGEPEAEPGDLGEDPEASPEPVPMRQNVRLDILVQHDSAEKLPGITIDIEMVDQAQQPKASWKLWVDTADLPKATGHQFVHLLEDVDYAEGDGFSVDVRSPVPAAERGDYREFSGVAGG